MYACATPFLLAPFLDNATVCTLECHALVTLQMKGRIDARNSLEAYCFNVKNTVEDKLAGKISADKKDEVWRQSTA